MRIQSLIRLHLSLQVHWVVQVVEGPGNILEAHLERIQGRWLVCRVCGGKARYRDRRKLRRWKDLSLVGRSLVIVYAPCRVSCGGCGVHVEQVPWARGQARVTQALAKQVALWSRRLSWKDTSKLFGINWKTVVAIVRYCVEWGLKHRNLKPIHILGMDEVSRRKGHKYLSLFYDLKRKILLWIGEDRTEATVQEFFEWFGKHRTRTLRAVCLDMWRPYMNIVQEKAPQALRVFDRFHLVRHLNEAVDQVRRQFMAQATGVVSAQFKRTRYLWLTNPWNLSPEKRGQLSQLLKLNVPLVKAYVLKEAFHKFWDYQYKASAKKWLDAWFWMATHSRLEPLRKFAWLVRRHEDGILAWIDLRISNGALEGMNNKIALVKRRAFGLRKPETQKLAIYHCCANLPLPAF